MQNKIVIVVGPKGSGKTHRVRSLIQEHDRTCTFDLLHEQAYAEDGAEIICGNPQQLYQAIPTGRDSFHITYRPVTQNIAKDGNLVDCQELEPFIKLCYLRGNVVMVIDEAHLICNSRNCPRMLMVSNLVGRHRELSFILVCQKLSVIPGAIRENTDEFYFYKIIEPASLDAVEDRCGSEVRSQVEQLRAIDRKPDGTFVRAGQCLHWSKFQGVIEVTE